jgi:hypothetical protein
MRRPSVVIALAAALASGCGGGSNEPVPPPHETPPPQTPTNDFPSAAGTWRGTATYSRCEETDGFGFCAGLRVPKSTSFQTIIAQTSETHSVGGLTVANVTGTITLDGMPGNLSGIIDDVGSIFFDDDVFNAPISPTQTERIRNWIGQVYAPSWFGNFRIFVTPNGGGAGQAIVNVTLSDITRVSR